MTTQTVAENAANCPQPVREVFACTGETLERIIAFGDERGWEDKPFHFIVTEWKRSQLH